MSESALQESEVGRILRLATEEVLETMFFTGLVGPAAPPEDIGLAALVAFRGAPSGICGIRMSEQAAREMAASFLGAEIEELTPDQIAQVISEFANMICGSVVSRLESAAQIELDPPRLVPEEEFRQAAGRESAECWFELEHGTLGLMLDLAPVSDAGGAL